MTEVSTALTAKLSQIYSGGGGGQWFLCKNAKEKNGTLDKY